MYCARCGNEVGVRDLRCAMCDADLNSSGALRLTDPRLDPNFVPVGVSDETQGAVDVDSQENVEDAQLDAVEKSSLTEPGQVIDEAEASGEEETGSENGGDIDQPSDENESGDSGEAGEAPTASDEGSASDETVSDETEHKKDKWSTKFVEQVSEKVDDLKGEVAKLNTALSEPENLRQLAKTLGYDTQRVAPAKVMGVLAILAFAIVIMVVLMGQLMNIDKVLLPEIIHTPTPSASASKTPATQSQSPSPSGSAQPEEAVSETPKMIEGAKECDPGVWAGPQTSCPLANAVGEKVDRKLDGAIDISAVSSVTQREYTLHCTSGHGITCEGTGDVEGVFVWLVA